MKKRIILNFGVLASIAVPISFIVSCGNQESQDSTKNSQTSTSDDLYFRNFWPRINYKCR